MEAGAGQEPGGTFVVEQRRASAPVNRVLAQLGAATFALFALTNPLYMNSHAALLYNIFAVPAIILLLSYSAFTASARFPYVAWSEFYLFVLMSPIIYGVVYTLSLAEDDIGWAPHSILFCNGATILGFASLAFISNFRALAIWSSGHILIYIIWLRNLDISLPAASFNLSSILILLILGLYTNWSTGRRSREVYELGVALRAEKMKSEELLYSILPEEVATRLRNGQAVADSFSDASVIFVDLVGSSELARSLSPKHFIQILDEVFSLADEAAARFKVEKVKTIGDAYLAVSGARSGGDPLSAVLFASSIVREIQSLAASSNLSLNVRVGIHNGPVVGGVIGNTRATYDYWGDTMNIAARVEGAAPVGGVAVTRQVYYATREQILYGQPRLVTLKGIGELPIYDVVSDRTSTHTITPS